MTLSPPSLGVLEKPIRPLREYVYRIAMIIDGRLSSSKRQLLAERLHILSRAAQLEFLSTDTSEEGLIETLKDKQYHLVLAPWYLYFEWGKIDAFLGTTRTHGCVFGGYFAEPLTPFLAEFIISENLSFFNMASITDALLLF